MKDFYIAMGCRLRNEREKLGLTQWQMAELLEISITYYGTMERGVNGISTKKLVLLWDKLRIDPLYILTGEHHNAITDRIVDEWPIDKRKALEYLIECAVKLTT